MKFIFYINWWVDRACLGLLSSVIRALYHMFLRFLFLTNLKFWPSFKPMIIYRSAKGEVLKKVFLVVCSYEAQTLRNGCIASLLPSHQFLKRTGEVLWRNGHFTKITALPPYITYEGFFLKTIEKNRFLEHVKFIFYINWWVHRACLGLLFSVIRALYHMFLRLFFFTNLKFCPSFKR